MLQQLSLLKNTQDLSRPG